MIKTFEFDFTELQIVSDDLEELLGFQDGILSEPFPEYISQALTEAPDYCKIKGGYKIFDKINLDIKNDSITIENQLFKPARIVCKQLKKSTSIALFVCTAGQKIADHSKYISSNGDPMLGYIFDIIGSVVVEKAMDKIQAELKKAVSLQNLNISDRYSPGYCEWNVSEQQKLFTLLPSNFCEISLSESSLMSPIKSVSGFIGIGKDLKEIGYQCNWCTDTHCIYGKINRKKRGK